MVATRGGVWLVCTVYFLCTAIILTTATMIFSLGVPIVLAMLVMRGGGTLVIAPVVDAITRRRVHPTSWLALGLSAAVSSRRRTAASPRTGPPAWRSPRSPLASFPSWSASLVRSSFLIRARIRSRRRSTARRARPRGLSPRSSSPRCSRRRCPVLTSSPALGWCCSPLRFCHNANGSIAGARARRALQHHDQHVIHGVRVDRVGERAPPEDGAKK